MTSATPEGSRLLRGAVVGTVVGLLVYAGLVLWADLEGVQRALAQLEVRTVLEAAALVLAGYALRFGRWEVYRARVSRELPGLAGLSRLRSGLVFLSGLALTVSPGKLGEAFKSVLLKEEVGAPVARTAPMVLAERLTDLLALLLLIGLANASTASEHAWILPVALALCGAALLLLSSPRAAALGVRALGRLGPLARLQPKVEQALSSARVLLAPGALAAAVLLGTGAWALECVAAWRIAGGLGLPAPGLAPVIAAFSLSLVAGAIALFTPGGLGVTEGLLTDQLRRRFVEGGAAVDAARAGAASATLLTRLMTLWFAVALGLGALALHRRGVGRRSA
jgi:hypothetical protein